MTLSITNPLVGTWRLISMVTELENGEIYYGFGKNPNGIIIYSPCGHMSAHIVNPNRPTVRSADQQRASDDEVRQNFEGYIAYFGTYEINENESKVIHHVEGSLYKNWEGDVQERLYEISGNRIKLTTPPISWGDIGSVVTVLEWKKLGQ